MRVGLCRRFFDARRHSAMSAAAARGRARLDAFRARRASAEKAADAVEAREGDGLKINHADANANARDATRARVETSVGDASRDGAMSSRAEASSARTTTGVDVVAEENARGGARDAAAFEAATPFNVEDDDAREVANAGETTMGVRNAYADLADAYVETVVTRSDAATREDARDAKTGVLGVTTSTDRAREQYERVMRAIGGGAEIDARLFDDPERADDGANDATDEAEKSSTETFPELDAIIEQVRVSGVISDASSRVVRDDQSEISMLQEVIDDMTTEKLGLMRGLQKSQAMVDKLANENDALMQRYNETKSQLSHTREELDRLWLQYQERSAMGGDNDGLMMGNPDTSERVQSLAAEVVALEERLQDMARIEDENDRLRAEAKRSNSHASELELVLEATREQDRLFKERIRESNFMKTLEKLDEDEAVFLCAWLKKKDADVEREAREKASSMEKQREQAELSANTTETDDEQIELLSSIHELLEQLEIEKKTLSRQLNSANEAKQQLSERNTLLESQLAKVLNRLADGGDGWSSEEEKPRRGGLFSFLRRRQE